MNKFFKFTLIIASITVLLLVVAGAAFAQENGAQDNSGEQETQVFQVKSEKVKIDSVVYPIYPIFKMVFKGGSGSTGGITYNVVMASEKSALSLAKKITSFYKGKKINGVKVPKFSVISKPDTTAWYSLSCKNEKGIQIIVNVIDSYVGVYLLPNECSTDVQAFIL